MEDNVKRALLQDVPPFTMAQLVHSKVNSALDPDLCMKYVCIAYIVVWM